MYVSSLICEGVNGNAFVEAERVPRIVDNFTAVDWWGAHCGPQGKPTSERRAEPYMVPLNKDHWRFFVARVSGDLIKAGIERYDNLYREADR
jgi:hypothetical protein